MKEIWKSIPNFPGYQVSNLGRVWSEKTKRVRKAHTQQKGYWHIVLSYKNKTKTIRLNRLVLEVFVGPAPTEKHHAAHKDGDKNNNTVFNLYWATPQENVNDRKRHGTYYSGCDHPMAKLTRGDLVYAKWRRKLNETWVEIGADIGVTPDVISKRVRAAEMAGDI